MPHVAAIPIMRYTGQTARKASPVGKLSPQVTDEGKTSGSISPHPARGRATFSPKGEGFPAAIPAMQPDGKIAK